MPKYLFFFEKDEQLRWLGHLDILRTFERAIRRAALPVAFSTGFNPREKLSFASALSTGVTSSAEPAILELTETLFPDELLSRLNATLPIGLHLIECSLIPDSGYRDLLNSYDRADYTVICANENPPEAAQIETAIQELLAKDNLSVTRERQGRVKEVNIRVYLHQLALCGIDTERNRITFAMTLALGEAGNAKPAEVIAQLSEWLPGLTVRRIHRERLHASPLELSISE